MANSYNSLPIRIDTTFVSWEASQTLNTGTLPSTLQNPGPINAQWGLQIYQMLWKAPGASASFTVTDPDDGTVLFNSITPAAFVGADPYWFFQAPLQWRDFSVTISAGTLHIWYRS
jgi:hypothetical protein